MKARKGLKWLAVGLVMAASMVLLGCPHNNLIEHDVVSGSGATSGRGSNGGVKLVITNFTDNSAGTNRANNAVLNPLRSIAPDHINLKDRGTVDKYVFIAEGESSAGQKYEPEFITVDGTTGEAALGISGSGVWTVTVSAYEVSKLTAVGSDKNNIMTAHQPSEVIVVSDALILKGKATLNLGMNASGAITVTLTNDGVGTDGNVLVTVDFDDGDTAKINVDPNQYVVKAGLYSYETGELVGQEDTMKIAGDSLTDPDVTSINDVPKGRYQFRVTVIDDDSGDHVAYWTDDIIVEGNRDVTQEVTVSKLFETPEKPSAAGIYWSQKESPETREGFLGYLSWEGMPFNAVGVDVQIANITKWYKFEGGQDKIDFTGAAPEAITDATMLWQKIETLGGGAPAFTDVVTELKWSDVPQQAKQFPAIYKSGSVLNGSNGVVFLMQTGQVYSVRIRAAGARGNSNWLIIDQLNSQAMTEPEMLADAADNTKATGGNDKAHKFNDTKLGQGIFDLVQLKYDLEGKYELAKTSAAVAKDAKATASDLVVYKPYGENITISLKYNDMNAPADGDWFLYSIGGADINTRLKGWKGWKGVEDPTQTFVTTAWGDYSGHKNLTLVTVGGDASVKVESETAGTFNVLVEGNVLVQIRNNDTDKAPNVDWSELVNGDANPTGGGINVKTTDLGIQKDVNRYILNVDKDDTTKTWLYVSVGSATTTPGTLEDENTNQFTVKDIKVTLLQNGVTVVKQFSKGSECIAYADMAGLQTGTYTLRVEVLGSSGYWVSYQTPLAIKNDTQVIL